MTNCIKPILNNLFFAMNENLFNETTYTVSITTNDITPVLYSADQYDSFLTYSVEIFQEVVYSFIFTNKKHATLFKIQWSHICHEAS